MMNVKLVVGATVIGAATVGGVVASKIINDKKTVQDQTDIDSNLSHEKLNRDTYNQIENENKRFSEELKKFNEKTRATCNLVLYELRNDGIDSDDLDKFSDQLDRLNKAYQTLLNETVEKHDKRVFELASKFM